jgi:hypothetical protein
MSERRTTGRQRVLKAGKIVFNNGASVLDCTVRNVSGTGACLMVVNALAVPAEFDLRLDCRPAALRGDLEADQSCRDKISPRDAQWGGCRFERRRLGSDRIVPRLSGEHASDPRSTGRRRPSGSAGVQMRPLRRDGRTRERRALPRRFRLTERPKMCRVRATPISRPPPPAASSTSSRACPSRWRRPWRAGRETAPGRYR